MTLFTELAVATAMVAFTVALHLGGLAFLLSMLRRHRIRTGDAGALVRDGIGILLAAFGLFLLHAAEIWGYALLYVMLGALSDFESALYFSTSTYATIGYGDVVLPPGWRVLGAIEGANGVILLGWSTAFFVAIVSRIRLLERELEVLR
ncbi:MAG: potassium channel family protein [Sphingomonas sp.]|uniref:potassium channel family protein n=1 Tax=Sphingomonas sp. TaxID=28214 RepID=UPI00356B164A